MHLGGKKAAKKRNAALSSEPNGAESGEVDAMSYIARSNEAVERAIDEWKHFVGGSCKTEQLLQDQSLNDENECEE